MGNLPNPVLMVIVLAALSLAPFIAIMLSSFAKIAIVLSILRNALGAQSVPPAQVITGLALVLSLFVMTPVVRDMYKEASISNTQDVFSEASVKTLFAAVDRGKEPLRGFLAKHAHPNDRVLFMQLAARLEKSHERTMAMRRSRSNVTNASIQVQPAAASVGTSTVQATLASISTPLPAAPAAEPALDAAPPVVARVPAYHLDKDDFQVLIPAFVTSQLKEAFEVGFLVFVPFIIIDMVVANILLAMGMSMLSPSVVSLPFKLLLFVLVDGWFLIVRGLVLSYA